jgi:DNA primase
MNKYRVDFKKVKSQVSMRMALEYYGVTKLKQRGDELRGRCPIHKGEGDNTFHANTKKNIFRCFSCDAHGNVLDFVAAMERSSVKEAAEKLTDIFRLGASNRQVERPTPKTVAEPKSESGGDGLKENKVLGFELKGIKHDHPYLAGRDISKEVAEFFGIGYYENSKSPKVTMNRRIVIPIHNERGELVGYAGRAIGNSEPRYKFPPGFHKVELYNLHRALKKAGERGTVVLVEGFFGCISVFLAGFPCVALMGSTMAKEQELLLKRHFSGVVLMLDGDEAGRLCTDDCLLRLGRLGLWLRVAVVPEGIQPDQIEPEEIAAFIGSGKQL